MTLQRKPGRPRSAGAPAMNGEAPAIAPAPRPPTATEELARLKSIRDANNGWIVPPPSSFASARLVFPREGAMGDGQPQPNAELKAALAWFAAIVDAGGLPADLQLAWDMWRPEALGEASPKYWAASQFEALKVKAGSRQLAERAEREALPLRHVESLKRQLRLAREREADIAYTLRQAQQARVLIEHNLQIAQQKLVRQEAA